MGELQDLSAVILECRQQIERNTPSTHIGINSSLWEKIKAAYAIQSPSAKAELVGHFTIKITTAESKSVFVSAQEIPQILATIPYARAALTYQTITDELARYLGVGGRNTSEGRLIFGELPSADWQKQLPNNIATRIEDFLSHRFPDRNDHEYFRKFLGSRGQDCWSGISKSLNRSDWLKSAIPQVGGWLAQGAAERGELVIALANAQEIDHDLAEAIHNAEADTNRIRLQPQTSPRLPGGENILFYGAPGTGKSHSVWQMIDAAVDHHFVTVFHPDMQNSDFTGTLKPGVDGDGKVSYAFRPGPFARAVACAWTNPGKKVYLVIEELNRAVAAAVFGELFQLLDRDQDGKSCYEVDFPSPEFAKWFEDETGQTTERLSLPSNLWILATMNSADQGVYPLDTAFRRRWKQRYLPIDYSNAPEGEVEYISDAGPQTIKWRDFIETLNTFLVSQLQINEDRLVGPRFVNEQDLSDSGIPGKLLIYLWDDLLRHHNEKPLFHDSIRTYGELHLRLSQGKQIFSDNFIENLNGADAGTLQ